MTDDEIRALLDACKFRSDGEAKAITDLANAALEARSKLRFVIDERDRTFALMLARADAAEAEAAALRDRLAVLTKPVTEAEIDAALAAHVTDKLTGVKWIDDRLTLALMVRNIWDARAALQSTPAQKEQSDE